MCALIMVRNAVLEDFDAMVHNMNWWKGNVVEAMGEKIMVNMLYHFLDEVCRVPARPVRALMRMPISGIYKIKGDVLAGRVEQGLVKLGEWVIFASMR